MSFLSVKPCAGEERAQLSCFVCGWALEPPEVKQLKRHLLRVHGCQHFCLFCVEKKSWSDEFVSQAAYHAHFQARHIYDSQSLLWPSQFKT